MRRGFARPLFLATLVLDADRADARGDENDNPDGESVALVNADGPPLVLVRWSLVTSPVTPTPSRQTSPKGPGRG